MTVTKLRSALIAEQSKLLSSSYTADEKILINERCGEIKREYRNAKNRMYKTRNKNQR